MTTTEKAEELVRFIRGLSDFSIVTEIDGNYQHLGATIADAILQANRNYEAYVRPRIRRVMSLFPAAADMSGLRRLLAERSTVDFLNWPGAERVRRFDDVLTFLFNEGIQAEDDLRRWLTKDENVVKLRTIRGIGPKTVDYLKILTGVQTCAIDRRLLDFLAQCGIEFSGYVEAQEIINKAADIMGVQRAYFDHSIWEYIGCKVSKRARKKCTP